jgi:cation:H+ antiporter
MEILALLGGGLFLLIGGGEILVRGAISLAKNLGVSAAVIGLTVLAYGTSAPELVVSLESAIDGYTDMALGNIVGSNISNTLLILGVVTCFYPLTLTKDLLRPDGYLLLLVSLMLWLFALNGPIGWIEGVIFTTMMIGHGVYSFVKGKRDGFEEFEAEVEAEVGSILPQPKAALYTIAGLIIMVLGGKLIVNGGVQAAEFFGVSEGVIGLTIIAIGTSLPELATSLLAARKGEAGMAIGNVVGSNLMNIFGIVGLTALVEPLSAPQSFLETDIPLLMLCSVILVFGIWRGLTIGRIAGMLGTAAFLGYIAMQYY